MVTWTDKQGITHVRMANGDHYTVRGNNIVKVKASK